MYVQRYKNLIVSLLFALPVLAQDYASLSGTVTDSSGALIQGARVAAVSQATGLRRETLTGATGIYQIPALGIGIYTVNIAKQGFKSTDFGQVEISVGQPRTIDARLEVGAATESVEVLSLIHISEPTRQAEISYA